MMLAAKIKLNINEFFVSIKIVIYSNNEIGEVFLYSPIREAVEVTSITLKFVKEPFTKALINPVGGSHV